MKALKMYPAIAAMVIVTGTAMFALAEDENVYRQDPTLPPSLQTPEQQQPSPVMEEPADRTRQEPNGELNGDMNGEMNGDAEESILLPAPRPVQEPRQTNGEMKANGEMKTNGNGENGEAQEVQTVPPPEGNADLDTVEGWPMYPYGEYLSGDGEAGQQAANGEAEYRNGERQNGEWQELETNGEDVVTPYDEEARKANGDMDHTYKNGDHEYKDGDHMYKNGDHEYKNGDHEYKDGDHMNGVRENGEWQELETNGEDTVTPYTDKEMRYEDRDGENGNGGWYDDDDEDDYEFLENRTGHRFGWPGLK